ncbi:MAG: S8 family serine peptidase [Bacteroidales bacterium]
MGKRWKTSRRIPGGTWFPMTLLLVLGLLPARTQEIAGDVYWLYFTDKGDNGYDIDRPEEFLTPRSLDRRAWQGLGVDERDEPLTEAYLEQIRELGGQIRHRSRWLNGVALTECTEELFLDLLALPFTDTLPWEPATEESLVPGRSDQPRFSGPVPGAEAYDYGIAREQVELIQTRELHRWGYRGEGVHVAVLDAGFYNVDSLTSFAPMRADGRLLGTRNFVRDRSVFRETSTHGMHVLSILGGEWDGNLVGTAPKASYLLCMTEHPDQETRLEEIAWIEAAEYADSLGFDVINTSLGYSLFDDPGSNYTYEDMDGRTTFISRAASLTASRGMIACISAGNQGNDPWHYITAPADATNILTVGAVDSLGTIAAFSSRGPTADGRVKPDVSAMGVQTGVQTVADQLARGSGTSFSSPTIAGSVASLWQAFPETPAQELMEAVRESAYLHESPNNDIGHGIPNFARALHLLTSTRKLTPESEVLVYPNPVRDRIHVAVAGQTNGPAQIRLFSPDGVLRAIHTVPLPADLDLGPDLEPGLYILQLSVSGLLYHQRILRLK